MTGNQAQDLIVIKQEIVDRCMCARQRVPVIDIRMPLQAVICEHFVGSDQFFDTVGAG
jgi:hypothetical protein